MPALEITLTLVGIAALANGLGFLRMARRPGYSDELQDRRELVGLISTGYGVFACAMAACLAGFLGVAL